MKTHDLRDITIAALAGLTVGFMAFAIQEAVASNERVQKELVVWQASAPVPPFNVSDELVERFTKKELPPIESAAEEKYGVGFEKRISAK